MQTALSRFKANGETALYDALAVAFEHLKKGNRDKKVLIVVSDGGDNASKQNLSQILTLAEQSDAIIYTSGIYTDEDPDRNPGALRQLAKATSLGIDGLAGSPLGRIEISSIDLTAMIMEGVDGRILRHAVGHIPGTPCRVSEVTSRSQGIGTRSFAACAIFIKMTKSPS